MKLKLEIFKEVGILQISESLAVNEIDLLKVGFERLLKLPIKWLFLDLTHVVFTEAVLVRFIELRPYLESKLKNLLLVGCSPELCHFTDLRDAYLSCQKQGCNEATFLMEKWSKEQRISELRRKKELMSSGELGQLSEEERKSEIAKLRRETFRLKKLQSFLINDMVRQAYEKPKPAQSESSHPELKERCQNAMIRLKLAVKLREESEGKLENLSTT